MSGSAITEFTTLMESQGPAYVSGPDKLINELQLNSYAATRLLQGDLSSRVGGGDVIKDRVFLEGTSTFERYNPNAPFDQPITQTGTDWSVNWSFAKVSWSWNDTEIDLNNEKHTGAYRRQVYKKVMKQKLMNAMTDAINSVEAELWAQPNNATMEASSLGSLARQPYSIPALINEETNGLAVGGAASADFTTVQTISPSTYSAWVPTQQSYTFDADSATPNTGIGALFNAMSKACHSTSFQQLPRTPEYAEKTSMPRIIWTNLQGVVNFEHGCRSLQDTFRGSGKATGQDPAYMGPTFYGIPVQYISTLDTAAIYPTGSSGAYDQWDTTTNSNAGPRYWGINGDYMKLFFHEDHYWSTTEPLRDVTQPFSWTQYASIWNNLFCTSRRRHWIVYPSANTDDA